MKKTISLIFFGALIFGSGFVARHELAPIRAVHAQSACDATSLSGGYSYSLSGYAYDSSGNVYILASVGRMAPDGAGNLAGSETFDLDGTIQQRKYTGTYTMNSDCTGSMVWQVTQGNSTSTTHADFSAANNSREINFIQTDTDVILSGTFKKQVQ